MMNRTKTKILIIWERTQLCNILPQINANQQQATINKDSSVTANTATDIQQMLDPRTSLGLHIVLTCKLWRSRGKKNNVYVICYVTSKAPRLIPLVVFITYRNTFYHSNNGEGGDRRHVVRMRQMVDISKFQTLARTIKHKDLHQ